MWDIIVMGRRVQEIGTFHYEMFKDYWSS
jgi:hypothetical protein